MEELQVYIAAFPPSSSSENNALFIEDEFYGKEVTVQASI